MGKAYFEKPESDKRHMVTIRLIEAGRDTAVVEVTTNATEGELGRGGAGAAAIHYAMRPGTPQSGFTVVIED